MTNESEIRRGILTQASDGKLGSGLMWQDALHNEIAVELVRDKCVIGEVDGHGMALITGIREKGRIELDEPVTRTEEVNMPGSRTDPKKVFVVHGRDGESRDSMFAFLRALTLHPIEWSEAIAMTGKGSPFIGEILDAAFDKAQAVM